MDKSTSMYVKRKAVMGWSKPPLFLGAILFTVGLCSWAGAARANCNAVTAELIGQMPDLIFLTGQSSTVESLDVLYTAVMGGRVVAESTSIPTFLALVSRKTQWSRLLGWCNTGPYSSETCT
jgi:hypothetical protein